VAPEPDHVADPTSSAYDRPVITKTELIERILLPLAAEFSATSTTRVPFVRDPEAVLFGKQGMLDSLALVSFLLEVEARVESSLGRPVELASEHALCRKTNPFQTVNLLADYILELTRGTPSS
jgi:hypothetical protein